MLRMKNYDECIILTFNTEERREKNEERNQFILRWLASSVIRYLFDFLIKLDTHAFLYKRILCLSFSYIVDYILNFLENL